MAAASSTLSFISRESANQIIIDGSAKGTIKTRFNDDVAVQLRRARTEESGFQWETEHARSKIRTVVLKDVLIYDDTDIACLVWFIQNQILIEARNAYVSPDSLGSLISTFNRLQKMGLKVVEGSTICLPILQGLSGYGQTDAARLACQSIGFQVLMG